MAKNPNVTMMMSEETHQSYETHTHHHPLSLRLRSIRNVLHQ
jgi:hypothetical protein